MIIQSGDDKDDVMFMIVSHASNVQSSKLLGERGLVI